MSLHSGHERGGRVEADVLERFERRDDGARVRVRRRGILVFDARDGKPSELEVGARCRRVRVQRLVPVRP